MSINEMERKARELRELQALIEEATVEAEALKDAIKAAMGDAEEVHAGEYKITWKAVTSSRIDTAALKRRCLTSRSSSPRPPPAGSAWHENTTNHHGRITRRPQHGCTNPASSRTL